MAEYTPSVDASELTPQVLRATAATHWASRGFPPAVLQAMMGWHDPAVAQYYVDISGIQQHREKLKDRGRDPEEAGATAPAHPPTWNEIRPDDVNERIEIERWDLRDQEVPSHPRKTEEEVVKETVLDDFDNDGQLKTVLPGTAPLHVAGESAGELTARALREKRALEHDEDFAAPTLKHCAGVGVMCAALAAVLAVTAAVDGGWFGDPTSLPRSYAGLALGAVYATWSMDMDEPPE